MTTAAPPRLSPIRMAMHVTRMHIIAIACLAALTFGWLMTGQRLWSAVVFCAIDWFIVNFVNRAVDLAEDRVNGIAGTDMVGRHQRLIEAGCLALMLVSLLLGHLVAPVLTPWRVAFSAIGLAYNYRLIPTHSGRTRFKEMYFSKNFSSGVLFLLSTIAYPAILGAAHVTPGYLAVLVGFFLPLEITYEIIYDLRDIDGDAALNVPTFPVVHGAATSHRMIDGLLLLSAASLILGAALGTIGLKEFVLIGGVIQQTLYFHLRLKQGCTPERCIFVTWLGAAQIASYHVWILAGLPTTLGGW